MQIFHYENRSERADRPELRACWAATESKRALMLRVARPSSVRGAFRSIAALLRDWRKRLLPSAGIYCDFCGDFQELAPTPFDPREGVICASCGLCARVRCSAAMLLTHCDPSARVYVTEQATPLFARLQGKGLMVEGSEFEPDVAKREKLTAQMRSLGGKGEVQFQDVTALTFQDGTLDAILSCDVLEHVPDYKAAFAEFARVLAPGGTLVATFPFTDGEQTIVRATVDATGEVRHILPPEFHGDPISGGVLCFYHFGWDVLDIVREAGFSHVEMVMPWAPQRGYHYGLWTLLATR